MSSEKLESFVSLVASDAESLRTSFEKRTSSRFDYLPIQESPVLVAEAGLLILDVRYLWDRVTSGLYWIVHDHEKARSERDRQRWSQGFAEAVELLVEDQLRPMAPLALGTGTNFYGEEDLERAYGPTKRCDAALDFGPDIVLVEVVSGQLSVPSRIGGEIEQFKRDTDRLVVVKCRQLDSACSAVLNESRLLTGYESVPELRVLPLLVVGGGYPINPFTMKFVSERLVESGLFKDPRIHDLCIIDLGELEMLEGLAERGHNPVDVLRRWKESGISKVALRNFVLRTMGGGAAVRPSRMDISVKATLARVIAALRLSADSPNRSATSDTEPCPDENAT